MIIIGHYESRSSTQSQYVIFISIHFVRVQYYIVLHNVRFATKEKIPYHCGGGRVVRWCWVNFQCRGVLQLDYSRARAYCTCSRCGWGLFGHFTLIYPFSSLSPSLWETARYRLKYCLKRPFNPKQPTNEPTLPLY